MTKRSRQHRERPGRQEVRAETTGPDAAADAPRGTPIPVEAAAPAAAPAGEQEVERLQDRLLRLQAEFDNYRKRVEREREEQARRSAEGLMRNLLPTLDHFEIGLRAAAEDADAPAPLLEGMRIVLAELRSALEAEGLSSINAEGEPFDPQVHEAVAAFPSDEHPDGTVVQQVRPGYRLGNHLLRPASVIVARNESGPGDGPPDEGP